MFSVPGVGDGRGLCSGSSLEGHWQELFPIAYPGFQGDRVVWPIDGRDSFHFRFWRVEVPTSFLVSSRVSVSGFGSADLLEIIRLVAVRTGSSIGRALKSPGLMAGTCACSAWLVPRVGFLLFLLSTMILVDEIHWR